MQTLETIIANLKVRADELEQKTHPERAEQDASWERCKAWVDEQPANPTTVISKYPKSVHYKLSGKHNRVQVNMGSVNGFEVQFVLYDPIGEGEQKAFYAAFNNKTRTAYMRKLWEI